MTWHPIDAHYPQFVAPHPALPAAATNILSLWGLPLTISSASHDPTAPATRIDPGLTLTTQAVTALSRGRIAIQCGPASGDLVALEIRSGAKLNDYIKANPDLTPTLITRAGDYHYLWLRMRGDYPRCELTLKSVTWRGTGIVDVCRRDHANFEFRSIDSPTSIEFGKIKWLPDDYTALSELKRRNVAGQPLVNGKPNPYYWATRFVDERQIGYLRDRRCFVIIINSQIQALSDHDLKTFLAVFLKLAAESENEPRLLSLLEGPRWTKLIRTVQALGSVDSNSEEQLLEQFVRGACEPQNGTATTASEIWQAYVAFSRRVNPNLAVPDVARFVPGIIFRLFQIPRSNSVKRDGRAQVGFRGLALNEAYCPQS